jgi:DNA polymerase III subunit alpha
MIVPYHVHTHFSIQEAFCHIDELVAKAFELKLPALAITDTHSLSGCVEFIQEIEKKNKKSEHKVKPILGATFRLNLGKDGLHNIILLARNKEGWANLIRVLGESHIADKQLAVYPGDVIKHSANLIAIFLGGYTDSTRESLIAAFEHKFISVEKLDEPTYGLPHLTTTPVYYVNSEDQYYQQIVICSKLKMTMAEKTRIIEKYPEYTKFFNTNEHYLRDTAVDESSLQLLPLIEQYSIGQKPKMPRYTENGVPVGNPDDLLTQLCRYGWVARDISEKSKNDPVLREAYTTRIKMELEVFKKANLCNYMLVIRDIVMHGRQLGTQVGLRGSAGGCLISYLIGVSDVDPLLPDPTLPYHPDRVLVFERFYNEGRNTDDHVSLPDIDVDIGVSFRPAIIDYVKKKYGKDCVGNIITFGRMDGKGAIKEVFRVLHPVANAFEVANAITKVMVDASKVQDVLEDLKEDNPKYNVINYCIDHIDDVKDYYEEYKNEFDIAIKLANTIRTQGKHAAGIVIANEPLKNIVPMTKDVETDSWVVALEMADAEYAGAVKYDFLGVAAYEKIDKIIEMINNNALTPTVGVEVEEMDEEDES